MRFVHTADWQLGMTRHFLEGEAQARFTGARLEAVRSIGALAMEEGCEFVVVCGDVFETNTVDRQVVRRALDSMGSFPEVTFYLLPGNHDPLDPTTVYRSTTFTTMQPDNVVVLDSAGAVPVGDGVEIIAVPLTVRHPVEDLVLESTRDLPADGTIRIVVAHGAIDSLAPDKDDPALIGLSHLERSIAEDRIHFVALGDRHSTTKVGDTGRIWYSGAPEPTRYAETDPGNVLVVDVDNAVVDRSPVGEPDSGSSVEKESGSPSKVRVEVTPHRVGTWRFVRQGADLSGATDVEALGNWLEGVADKERTIVKLDLVGSLSLSQKAALDSLLDLHQDLLAALEVSDSRSDLAVIPDDEDYSSMNLSGFAADALEDLRALASEGGPTAPVAGEALSLLYRLAGAESGGGVRR